MGNRTATFLSINRKLDFNSKTDLLSINSAKVKNTIV
jgi:hypothetical protein